MTETQRTNPPPPISHGSIINDRYEIRQSLGKGGMGEVFLAYDRTTQQAVALKIVREESRMPGDDEALRQELLHARSVSHPNVCRVHDLAPSGYGPILVMEYITGQTLHTHIRRKKAQGGYTADEFRRIAQEVCQGVAAIHAQGLVHGDLKPGNVMVTSNPDGSFGKAIVLDFGFAKERARASARRPGAPPDGGTPNYMAPERIRSGGASQEDDLYALGLTLWEMWTCRVPEPGYKPRAKPMRQQIMFDVPAGLSVDEIKQIFRCLSDDPPSRIPARHLKFFNPVALTTNPIQVPRERLDPGPPPGRGATSSFQPGQQSLLATYATNAPDWVGEIIALDKPMLTIGRRSDVEIVAPEATVSGAHATLKWANGTWAIEDQGSTNGTYVEHTYERKKTVNLMHGGEVQFGELRLKLVSFAKDSAGHKRARAYLSRRDGLTGLLLRDHLLKALDEEAAFSDWIEQPLSIARYEIRGPNRLVSDRPTILEMLAFRRAATRVVELTDMLLLSLIAVTAGRSGPLRFAVTMMGPGPQEARNLVEQVVGQVQGMLPEGLDLVASIARYEPGVSVRSLVDPA
ncbi:MAG: protein kinase [Myxococcales bacterium]|jgi:serine/threonine-protein kinase|nr:protein kinase [Myxococcales bacterium]